MLIGYEPKHYFTAVVAPSVTDDLDLGYEWGSQWVDYEGGIYSIYTCVDPTRGAAVWIQEV